MADRTEPHARTPKTLTVDWALYERYLAEADLTDEEKRQFLEALWSIVVSFVDLGFGVHPAQQACGQLHDKERNSPTTGPGMVHLREEFQSTRPDADAAFTKAAGGKGV